MQEVKTLQEMLDTEYQLLCKGQYLEVNIIMYRKGIYPVNVVRIGCMPNTISDKLKFLVSYIEDGVTFISDNLDEIHINKLDTVAAKVLYGKI